MDVEVHVGGERRRVGTAQDSAEKHMDMREALRSVSALAAAGLFSLRHEAVWQFELEYETPEDWADFTDKPTCGGIEADPELLDAALSQPDGRIILTEENLTRVYERRASE